jgi:hypothetical protein
MIAASNDGDGAVWTWRASLIDVSYASNQRSGGGAPSEQAGSDEVASRPGAAFRLCPL